VKTELVSTQSDWDYLRTVDSGRAEQIAEKIEINEGTYYPAGSADEFREHISAGNAAVTTHSPVYVTITDSSGRKLGFNPEDKKVICEDNYSFCSSPSSYSDVQTFLIKGLLKGDYNIQLIGFEDGDFEIFFMLFNSSGIEEVQDINGSVKKGDVLSANFSVIKNDNNSFEVTPIIFEKVGSDYDVGSSPESVPFEVLSISPQNNTLFNDEKPIISLKFSNEVSNNNSFSILKDENGNFFTGAALINGRTLTFIPSAPLQSGNYTIVVNGLIDESGNALDNEMLSSFQVIRGSSKGIEYKLSSPKIYNLMERVKIENNNTAVLTNIKVRILFPENDYPNLLVKYVNSSIKPVISSDSYGNEWADWEIPSLSAGGELLIESNFTILVFDVDYFDYVNFSGINDSMPAGYELFTQPSEGIESNNALIVEKANEIVEETDNDYVKAEKVYEWVRNNIEYMYSGEGVPGGALQTLTVGKGTCHSYATLYAALLRALGIPTKYIISLALDDTADSHAYNKFYLSGYGWVPVDATWGASFNDWFLSSDTTHISLGELWPPERGLWISYSYGSFPITSELSIYETLDEYSLWDNTSKKLYDAADALSFKEKILEDLPGSIRIAVLNESNVFSASYVRGVGIYAELLNNKDNETLIIQEAAKAYFNGDNETADALLEGIPESIYNQVITECSLILNDYLEDLNNTKNVPDWENYEVYLPHEESLTFGYMFNQSLTWLVWADEWLALGNYSSTQSNLEWAVYYVY